MKIPDLKDEDVSMLEKEIDTMNRVLPEMKSFLLPGGHVTVSHIHIARCICRRAERCCVRLKEESTTDLLILKYLNRLSDYLFVLARYASYLLHVEETAWKPRIDNR
jgi:cob(I)alamin adenosyltransferase